MGGSEGERWGMKKKEGGEGGKWKREGVGEGEKRGEG